MEETFTYDNQNRLTEVWLGTTQTGMSAYDNYGRMTAKIADGIPVFFDASFSMAKPHAMGSTTTSSGVFPIDPQTVTYTGFDKVSKIKQGADSLCYTYGYDHQRIFMEEHVGNTLRTKRYIGNCEYITETNSNVTDTQWLTHLTGPTGVYAVVMTKNGSNQTFYILKDNLGSWTTITDEHGNVAQQLSYDAWGNLRNPNSWSGNYTGAPMFDRGYTGHEHLYNFGLINMNGRMYDPVMSSFLSVDQYVQSPENAQGFNRYAYCMNNPLRYIDPSGWRHVGGQTGYTPNSADFARDPYAYADSRGWEPRDFGIHELTTSDPIITWMEENLLHGGGSGGGNNNNTLEPGGDIKCVFGYGDPNSFKVRGVGACLFASLGMISKRLNHWNLDPVFWKLQEELYFAEKGQHGYDSNNLEDFIQWVGDYNNIDFSFQRIQIMSIPDAYEEKGQVLIVMELTPENTEKNEGTKGHVAVLNTYSLSSTRDQATISMSFGDPSPVRFLYNYRSTSPFILPKEVNSWLFYKFNINNLKP